MMSFASITIALLLFNAVTALSFTNIYLRGPWIRRSMVVSVYFVLINLAMGITGFLAGEVMAERMAENAVAAGGALAIVAGLKRVIKGWKTKVSDRFFDITKPKTLAGLMLALNIDTLLLGLAIAMISTLTAGLAVTMLATSCFAGISIAMLLLAKSPMIASNFSEIVAGITLVVLGIVAFF